MDASTCTTVRANLASAMDRVCDDHEALIITRNGEQSVVMLSLEDYKALEETAYLLRTPATAIRLLAAAGQLSGPWMESRLSSAVRLSRVQGPEAVFVDRFDQFVGAAGDSFRPFSVIPQGQAGPLQQLESFELAGGSIKGDGRFAAA